MTTTNLTEVIIGNSVLTKSQFITKERMFEEGGGASLNHCRNTL